MKKAAGTRWLRGWLGLTLAIGIVASPRRSHAWTFLVYGDSRGPSASSQINTNILTELARATTNLNPAFVLVPGDLVYSGNSSAFQGWTNLMAPVYQAGIGVYPVMGNHDADDVNAFKAVFGPSLPDNGPAGELDRTYAIRHSNALVLALDQYLATNTLRVNQPWINALLATNTQPHVFAFGHAPAFKVNHTDCLDDYPANRNAFWLSLKNAGCRLYFAGHDHFYDHLRADDGDGNPANDLHQLIVGTAGAPFHSDSAYNGNNTPWSPIRAFHEAQYGFVLVEVNGWNVTTTWYHRTGADTYAAAGDIFSYTWQPRLLPAFTNGTLVLSWTGGGVLQAAPDLSATFTNITDATSPHVATNLDAPSLFYRVKAP